MLFCETLTRLQFQYLNIARYAQRISKDCKLAKHKQRATETAYSNERKQRRQVQQQLSYMNARAAELEKADAKLQKWEARKAIINHYLDVIEPMSTWVSRERATQSELTRIREIQSMRSQLRQLGYRVSDQSYAHDPEAIAPKSGAAKTDMPQHQHADSKSCSCSPRSCEGHSDATCIKTDHTSCCASRQLLFFPEAQARSVRPWKGIGRLSCTSERKAKQQGHDAASAAQAAATCSTCAAAAFRIT